MIQQTSTFSCHKYDCTILNYYIRKGPSELGQILSKKPSEPLYYPQRNKLIIIKGKKIRILSKKLMNHKLSKKPSEPTNYIY